MRIKPHRLEEGASVTLGRIFRLGRMEHRFPPVAGALRNSRLLYRQTYVAGKKTFSNSIQVCIVQMSMAHKARAIAMVEIQQGRPLRDHMAQISAKREKVERSKATMCKTG